MPLILPADFRAPLIIPGRRHRKVHWNRERSRAIAALGKYEREDWHRGLTWPQGLFGLAEKYFAKKNNPGCTCCDTAPDNSCGVEFDCYGEDAWAGGDVPDEAEVAFSFTDTGNCASCDTTWTGTFILDRITGLATFSYREEFMDAPRYCTAFTDTLTLRLWILCTTDLCSYEIQWSYIDGGGVQHEFFEPTATVKGTPLPWTFEHVGNTGTTKTFCTVDGPALVTGFA